MPAMIIGGSRRAREKEASLDAEREEISNMYNSMMDMIKKTSEDIESRINYEESKDTLESKLENLSKESSVFLSASKLANSSKLANQYSRVEPSTKAQSKTIDKFSKEEDRRLDKIAAEAQSFLKNN